MNDGYLFLIGCWIILILLSSHWLDGLWERRTDHVRMRRISLVFLCMVLILQGVYIPISNSIQINASSILVLGGLCLFLFWRDVDDYRWQMGSVVTFLGIFYAVAYQMFFLDPILMFMDPVYLIPMCFTLFLLLTTTRLTWQWQMMVAGLIVGEVLHKVFMRHHVELTSIGDALFRDQLMIGILLITTITLTIQALGKLFRLGKRLLFTQNRQEG